MARRVLLAVAVVAAAAFVFWWLRKDDAPSNKTTPSVASGSSQNTGAQQAQRPERRGDVDFSQRVVIDDDPKGPLRLEGQVIDADEQPVSGATVVLTSNPPRTTTTEADGGFAFDGLVGRPYTLIARAPSGVAGPVTSRLTAKSDPIVLRLRPGAKLTVTVTGSDGKSVDGATVELRGIDEQRETTRAGKAVFTSVAPGGYQIAAWATGMARTFQWIQIGAGDAEAKVALPTGAAVAGRVIDDAGKPAGGARVRFSGASDWSQQGSDRLDGATTAADGAFRIEAMPAGTFRFTATHPERAPGSSSMITLDGKTTREGVTITLAAGAVVRGRVSDSAKQPVAAARIRIGSAVNPRVMIFEPPRQAYSDATGAFEIKGLPRRLLHAVALHDAGASQTVSIDTSGGDVSDAVLTLDVTGAIAGIVVDPSGQPVEGAQVSAGPSFADNRATIDFSQWRLRGFPNELTDASGKFTLAGLTPGNYMVSARSPTSKNRRGGPPGMIAGGEGVQAKTGDTNLKIVLAPEGAVKGKVAFADGKVPEVFTVAVNFSGQPFGGGDGEFMVDGLAPQRYELSVRGPSFQTRSQEVVVESGKTADVGTITVEKGRQIAGVVVADGQPVAGALVYAGRIVFGTGTASSAQFGPGAGAKKATTDASGAFSLSGFGQGDITIVAEHESIGRSRSLRLPTVLPGQTELTLVLEKYGALSGVLRQGGKPSEGVFVTITPTSTPGAIYSVASGPDGAYRFDRLAPDVYKVSAMLGMPMTGMKFYSKQIEVPAGREVSIDLVVDPGTVTLEVTAAPRTGTLGVAQAFLATGTIEAKTANELGLKMAAAGPGASQLVIIRRGEPARFVDVLPGNYTTCVMPYPAEVQGMAAMSYSERHGDTLPAFCKKVVVTAAPTQTAAISVELPAFIPDTPPPGTGSGSGSQTGSGSGS